MSEKVLSILQPVILEYRLGFYRVLLDKTQGGVQVYAGRATNVPNQKTPESVWLYAKEVENRYLAGGRLLWQSSALGRLCSAEILVVDSNLRNLSTLLLVSYRFIRGRPSIGWGHFSGKSRIVRKLRKLYFSLFSGFIAYTEKEVSAIRAQGYKKPIWSAFNACLFKEECYPIQVNFEKYTDFVFVNRLTEAKKPRLLIEAFIFLIESGRIPEEARLILIGDDPSRGELLKFVENKNLGNRVFLPGPIYETEHLKVYYRRAIASVSPGYVGLSVTQSCGFGVPVIVADNEPHSPEVAVLKDGENAIFFKSDSVSSLADQIERVYQNRHIWFGRREKIARDIRENYCFERMARSFIKVHEHFNQH